MKYNREDIEIDRNINGWIVKSDVYKEIKINKNNNKIYLYFVDAICRECGEIRKVRINDMLNGKSTKCIYCHGAYKQCKNYYQVFGKYSVLVVKNENGKVYRFIFDTKFIEDIKKYYWSFIKTNNNVYARCSKSTLNINLSRLHRYICELEYGKDLIKNKIIDHKDRNTFNTSISNLNIVTNLENTQNTNIRKDSSSGVKGVNYSKRYKKWCSRIQYNNKRIHLGFFDDFEEAVRVRKEAEKKYHKYNEEINKEND